MFCCCTDLRLCTTSVTCFIASAPVTEAMIVTERLRTFANPNVPPVLTMALRTGTFNVVYCILSLNDFDQSYPFSYDWFRYFNKGTVNMLYSNASNQMSLYTGLEYL